MQGQVNGFGHHHTIPVFAAPAVPTAIIPGPDDRAPIHANQIVPPLAAAHQQTNYSYDRSSRVHGIQIWHDTDRSDTGGLHAEMHLWLRFVCNTIVIEEHMVLRDVMKINGVPHFQLDRFDGSHVRSWFEEYTELGDVVKALAARCWTNVNLAGTSMRYRWWHVYENADYTVNPVDHGHYLGNLEHFRKNFCLVNGWAPV